MPPYRGPERGSIPYKFKWVKAGEKLIASAPNQRIEHDGLARQDGIYDDVVRYKQEDPIKADAGMATVRMVEGTDAVEISVWGASGNLEIPRFNLFDKIREDTIELFRDRSPGCIVRKSPRLFERYP